MNIIQKFADAFNRQDLEALLDCFTETRPRPGVSRQGAAPPSCRRLNTLLIISPLDVVSAR